MALARRKESRRLAGIVAAQSTAFVRKAAVFVERTEASLGTASLGPSFQLRIQARAHVREEYRSQQLHFGRSPQGKFEPTAAPCSFELQNCWSVEVALPSC